MSRTRVRYRCSACGNHSPQWLGRCPACGDWGSLEKDLHVRPAGGLAGRSHGAIDPAVVDASSPPVSLGAVDVDAATTLPSGIGELDRVLGGGLVPGSVTLLGGEPGVGKSTLVLQMLGRMAAAGHRCLLVSAEESPAQARRRAARLGALDDRLLVVGETLLPAILAHAASTGVSVLAVDSIQAVHDPAGTGVPGSTAQVRDGATALVRLAKDHGIATILVGHVTKDGTLAGPRVLEHVVDTVLSFEGDRHQTLRMLRATKHRFGPVAELGLFDMGEAGLADVPDAGRLFLADRRAGAPGSVVTAALDGARPLLVEVQALVHPTGAPLPRRSAQGFDAGRMAMLVAVLTRRVGVTLGQSDVFVSVAGGVRVTEPGGDLALVLAVASAQLDRAVRDDTVVLGEVGLGGEVRQVAQIERRLREAMRLGYSRAVVPVRAPVVEGARLVRVTDVDEAVAAVGLG